MDTKHFPKPRAANEYLKRRIPWPFRFLPKRFFFSDENLICIDPVAYAKGVENHVDRYDEEAIRFALAKTKPNPVSEAMETEVARIMLRIGSLILPLKTDRPSIRMRPPRDAFEKIAVDIAMSRASAALRCLVGYEHVQEEEDSTTLVA